MIVIIDYGMGNLKSVKNALDFLGLESKISSDEEEIRNASGLILPGVGAFPDAM
jgi:glutamine amidotransferase